MPEASIVLPVVISLVAGFAVAAVCHVWYATGVARVLAAHEKPTWRAWVPLLNEAELFRIGRVDPVKAALFLVPLVAIYALVLKAIAAHRIGAEYGRGAGATALAVLLPPVWATVLGGASPRLASSRNTEDDDVVVPSPGSAVAPSAGVETATPVKAPLAPPESVPAPPVIAPPAPPQISPSVFASAPPPATPIAQVPLVAAPADSVAAAERTEAPAAPVGIASDAPSPVGESVPEAPEERTQLTRGPRAWELVLPAGDVVAVTARTLVLGRKPQSDDAAVQDVVVADDTRTVSKQHARLAFSGNGWTITDLGSTNGVALLSADGTEQRLAADASAPVSGVFLLGDARLALRLSSR